MEANTAHEVMLGVPMKRGAKGTARPRGGVRGSSVDTAAGLVQSEKRK